MKRQSLISVLAACLCLLVASSAFAGTCEFDKKAVLAGLGELPSSLDELASLTRIERSVAMSELDSFTKARLWREHLAAQVDGMNLSSDQLSVIEHASSLISPKLFEANRGDLMFEAVVEKLKGEKLTIRNVPRGSAPADGTCIFTGEPAVERILVARAY